MSEIPINRVSKIATKPLQNGVAAVSMPIKARGRRELPATAIPLGGNLHETLWAAAAAAGALAAAVGHVVSISRHVDAVNNRVIGLPRDELESNTVCGANKRGGWHGGGHRERAFVGAVDSPHTASCCADDRALAAPEYLTRGNSATEGHTAVGARIQHERRHLPRDLEHAVGAVGDEHALWHARIAFHVFVRQILERNLSRPTVKHKKARNGTTNKSVQSPTTRCAPTWTRTR